MPEEPIDLDSNENEESTEDAEEDARTVAGQYEETESEAGRELASRALEASRDIDAQGAEMVNMRAVIAGDSEYTTDLSPVNNEGADADTAERVRRRLSQAETVHEDIGRAHAKGRLVTRLKFWAVVAPLMVQVFLAMPISLSALILSAQKKRDGEKDDTETAGLPPALKDLITEKAREWSTKAVKDAFTAIAKLTSDFNMSLEAQVFLMGELKRLAPQPDDAQKTWIAVDQDRITTVLVDEYGSGGSKQMFESAADTTIGSPERNLTVHEAADCCDLALSEIIILSGRKS